MNIGYWESMITFFTIPKAFKGHISIIQRNAIISWLHLHPDCEIILYGDEEGIKEIADEFGLIHIPNIKKNEYGTPFLDFVFDHAQSIAKNNILCYVNADIIFFKDFIDSIQAIKKDPFLVVGKRWEIDVSHSLCFSDEHWVNDLRTIVENYGKEGHKRSIDYFAFSKTAQLKLLPFLVGREGWDNWLIYYARKKSIFVVDISQTTRVIHQNHDYNHVPLKKGERWQGPETDYNMNLIGSKIIQKSRVCMWTIDDTEYILIERVLVERQKGIFDKTMKKIIIISPGTLYPILGLFILTFFRTRVIFRNMLKKG
jgi:hypothetical protein